MSTPSSASTTRKTKVSTAASAATVKSNGSSRLYDVPSLEDNGTNFQMWKFRVRMILGVRGLWKIVNGDETKPDETTHPTKSEEWLPKDREALAQITLTLKDEPLSGVLYTTTSAHQQNTLFWTVLDRATQIHRAHSLVHSGQVCPDTHSLWVPVQL